MAAKVLVAYASKYGSTQEIAEKIGEALKQAGLQADVKPVKSVNNLSEYKEVIIGSAMYIGSWRKEAVNFLKKNEKTLAGQKVWVFSTGPSGKGDPAQLLKGVIIPSGVKTILDRIKPRDVAVFHGSLNPEKMKGLEKWMVKRVGGETGDFRDWEMIKRWGEKVAGEIKG
jgi:menaquinone-dependent protoporphyrinogen oxidase